MLGPEVARVRVAVLALALVGSAFGGFAAPLPARAGSAPPPPPEKLSDGTEIEATAVISPGARASLSFPGSYDFENPSRPCGDLGCPYHGIFWWVESGQNITFLEKCGTKDTECVVTNRSRTVGDAAERWSVMKAQHYDGIYPMEAYGYATYTPPSFYPVEVRTLDETGRAADPPPSAVAFAVKSGSSPREEDCARDLWYSASDAPAAGPDCITLRRVKYTGQDFYWWGVLPNTGTWQIVAAPAGDASLALPARPTRYPATSVTPRGDDIKIDVREAARPQLAVEIRPATNVMELGDSQQVSVEVRAVGGDAGSLQRVRFANANILGVDSPAAMFHVSEPLDAVPTGGFTLERGASRTFRVNVRALGLGVADLVAPASAVTDLDAWRSATHRVPITLTYTPPPDRTPPADGDPVPAAPKPPVVTQALDAGTQSTRDAVEGYVEGPPLSWAYVSVAGTAGDPCSKRMTGSGVTNVGSVAVWIPGSGRGLFARASDVTAGTNYYGVTAIASTSSAVGRCTPGTAPAGNAGYTREDGAYEWIDASDGGTELAMAGPDDSWHDVTLPFTFPYWGTRAKTAFVSTNGMLTFPFPSYAWYNVPPQSPSMANGTVAPFWDDLHLGTGAIWTRSVGEAPERRFVIEWKGVRHADLSSGDITFQAVLYEGTGEIRFQYQDATLGDASVDLGKSANIAIKSNAGREWSEFSHWTASLGGYVGTKSIRFLRQGAALEEPEEPEVVPVASIGDAETVREGTGDGAATRLTFPVTIDRAPTADVTIQVSTAGGTASAGSDYTAITSQVLTFTPTGPRTLEVSVDVASDTADEVDETVGIVLADPSGLTIEDGEATGVIDDDDGPAIRVSDARVVEGTGTGTSTVTFRVSLSAASPQEVSVRYATGAAPRASGFGAATAGTDFVAVAAAAPGTTLRFPTGSTAPQTVTVQVRKDALDELDERFALDLSGALDATLEDAQGVAVIDDDDAPSLRISDARVTEGSGTGTSSLTFRVSLSAASPQHVSVKWATGPAPALPGSGVATAGADYAAVAAGAPGQPLVFAPNSTGSRTITIQVRKDALDELDERLAVTLSGAVDATIADGQGIGVIDDDDGPVIRIADARVIEGTGTGTTAVVLTVSLSAASPQPVGARFGTQDGTPSGTTAAATSADYVAVSPTAAASTVTVAAGRTTATFTVQVRKDALKEALERFFVSLASPVDGRIVGVDGTTGDGQGIVTIVDDD